LTIPEKVALVTEKSVTKRKTDIWSKAAGKKQQDPAGSVRQGLGDICSLA